MIKNQSEESIEEKEIKKMKNDPRFKELKNNPEFRKQMKEKMKEQQYTDEEYNKL